ncbi:MAG: hypothetical protein ACE5J5_07315 [Candidatus Hydrothermarchaeales archaeon]
MGIITDFINNFARPAPDWAKALYESRGKHYQARYDKIKNYELPEGIRNALQLINDEIPAFITKGFFAKIDRVYRSAGPQEAEKWIKNIFAIFGKIDI